MFVKIYDQTRIAKKFYLTTYNDFISYIKEEYTLPMEIGKQYSD